MVVFFLVGSFLAAVLFAETDGFFFTAVLVVKATGLTRFAFRGVAVATLGLETAFFAGIGLTVVVFDFVTEVLA